jgi:hypothetical protein
MVTLDELLEKVPRMDDDISKFLREMKDISVSFTPEDLIQNMASIGHIKTTETIPHSLLDLEEKRTLLISAKTAFVSSSKRLTLSLRVLSISFNLTLVSFNFVKSSYH